MSFIRRIPWPQEYGQVMFMAMEMSWLAGLLNLIAFMFEGQPSPLLLIWLYPPAYVLIRAARLSDWRNRAIIPFGTAAAAVALAIVIKSLLLPDRPWLDFGEFRSGAETVLGSWDLIKYGLFGLVFGAYIWLRGWSLAGKAVDLKGVVTGFQIGLAVLFAVMLLWSQVQPLNRAAGFWIACFVYFSLAAICQARFLDLNARGATGFNRRWAVFLPLLFLLILGSGLAVWTLVDRTLIEILLTPFIWMWNVFLRILEFLASLLPRSTGDLPPELMQPQAAPNPDIDKIHIDLGWVRPVAQFFFISAWAAMMLGAMFRGLYDLLRWFRKKTDPYGFAIENVKGGWRRDLAALCRWIFGLFIRLGETVARLLSIRPAPTPAETVRRLYRRFLGRGAARGWPKKPAETPHEYEIVLRRVVPDRCDAALSALTAIYAATRYGGKTPAPEDIAHMKRCYKVIQAARWAKPVVRKEAAAAAEANS